MATTAARWLRCRRRLSRHSRRLKLLSARKAGLSTRRRRRLRCMECVMESDRSDRQEEAETTASDPTGSAHTARRLSTTISAEPHAHMTMWGRGQGQPAAHLQHGSNQPHPIPIHVTVRGRGWSAALQTAAQPTTASHNIRRFIGCSLSGGGMITGKILIKCQNKILNDFPYVQQSGALYWLSTQNLICSNALIHRMLVL